MKKKVKKIVLTRETLMDLTKPEIHNAVGGATITGIDCIFCTASGENC